MFSEMFLFIFITVGTFALLFSFIPVDFFVASYSASLGAEKELIDKLSAADLAIYDQLGNDSMTYPYQSVLDGPNPPDWEIFGSTSHFFEVWWNEEAAIYGVGKALECRHTYKVWWWFEYHRMEWINPTTMQNVGDFMGGATLLATYEPEINGSRWYVECPHMTSSVLISYNETAYGNIKDAYDGGELQYTISYEANTTLSSQSAAELLSQLIAFQSPDLGIEGEFGDFANNSIATIYLAMVILCLVMVLQSVIPFIKGVPD